jgi:hypothetical protein
MSPELPILTSAQPEGIDRLDVGRDTQLLARLISVKGGRAVRGRARDRAKLLSTAGESARYAKSQCDLRNHRSRLHIFFHRPLLLQRPRVIRRAVR